MADDIYMFKRTLVVLAATIITLTFSEDDSSRRPIYNIGHMVNSIPEMMDFLKRGANALEVDVQFDADGTILKLYHGFPCDCNRSCENSADISEYFSHLQNITDPSVDGSYYEQMTMLEFDQKLSNVKNKTMAGRNLASMVLKNLWIEDGRQQVRILLSISSLDDLGALVGFVDELSSTGNSEMLNNVGIDPGPQNLKNISMALSKFELEHRIFQSDGITNCLEFVFPYNRLNQAIYVRDHGGFIDKVYRWTVDGEKQMERALMKTVDGMITNQPDVLLNVLATDAFVGRYRVATIHDDPFTKFVIDGL